MESAISSKDKIASKYQAQFQKTLCSYWEPDTCRNCWKTSIKKHHQTQDCWHHQQLASATLLSTAAADSPCVQRCRSSLRMVLSMSNIFHHLFGYPDYMMMPIHSQYLQNLQHQDPKTTNITKRQNEPNVTCNIVTTPW